MEIQWIIPNIFDSTNRLIICITCSLEKEIKLEGIIRFSELLVNNDYILTNFPPLEKSIALRIKQAQKETNKEVRILEKIEEYFKHLQTEIETSFSSAQSKAKEREIKLFKSNEEIFNKYNDLSKRRELRQIIKKGGEQMESKISEILSQFVKEEDIKNNSKILQECLDENKTWRESMNLEIPNQIKEAIISMICGIEFFQGTNHSNSNCDLLMELIGSKANFSEEEFLQKAKKMMEGMSSQINNYNLGDDVYHAESRSALQRLNENQMNSLIELSKKITEISETSSSQDIGETDINSTKQPKTSLFLSLLKDLSQQNQTQIKSILKQFPIFEISRFQQYNESSILSSAYFYKSTYRTSQFLKITSQVDGRRVVQSNSNNGALICYSSFIKKKSKSYIVRILLKQDTNNHCNHLVFGLPDSEKNSIDLYNQNLVYNESAVDANKMSKIIRGVFVAKGHGQPVNRELEMRICLEKKILRVSNYPEYSNVCEINDSNKILSDVAQIIKSNAFFFDQKLKFSILIFVLFISFQNRLFIIIYFHSLNQKQKNKQLQQRIKVE